MLSLLVLVLGIQVHAAEFNTDDPNLVTRSPDDTEASICIGCLHFNQLGNDICDYDQNNPICEMRRLMAAPGRRAGLRNDAARMDYFRFYQDCGNEDAFRGYRDRYRHLTGDAATAFGIPKALLECLMFQESKWHGQARSDTGAYGFGQFTENAADTVDSMIGLVSSQAEGKREIAQLTVELNDAIKSGDRRTASLKRAYIRNRNLNIGWLDYHDLIRGKKVRKNGRTVNVWTGTAPTSFQKMRDGDKPATAIGAVALLAAYHYSQLMAVPNRPRVRNQDDMIDLLALVGGFHNRGAGNLADRLGRPQPRTYAGWIQRLGKKNGREDPEAKKHMENMRRCLRPTGRPPAQGGARGRMVDQTPGVCVAPPPTPTPARTGTKK